MPCQGGQLEEGAVAVDEQLDALAREQLAPGAVPGHLTLTAAGDDPLGERVELGEGLEHRRAVRDVGRVAHVDSRTQALHELDVSVKFAIEDKA